MLALNAAYPHCTAAACWPALLTRGTVVDFVIAPSIIYRRAISCIWQKEVGNMEIPIFKFLVDIRTILQLSDMSMNDTFLLVLSASDFDVL